MLDIRSVFNQFRQPEVKHAWKLSMEQSKLKIQPTFAVITHRDGTRNVSRCQWSSRRLQHRRLDVLSFPPHMSVLIQAPPAANHAYHRRRERGRETPRCRERGFGLHSHSLREGDTHARRERGVFQAAQSQVEHSLERAVVL